MPAELGSMFLGDSMPPAVAIKVAMQDKVSATDYKISLVGAVAGLASALPLSTLSYRGTWCGPCKEALSHSTEEYARLKDFDIQYLYLANRSPQTSWENVIKEYNVSGPNVAHYNLPEEQQAAIERHLNVHSWPTYKLFDRNGNLLDLQVDPRDIENLARLLEGMK